MRKDDFADEDAYIAFQLSKWDRALLIVSIPHGAAFGAFVGRYDFDKNGQPEGAGFISICILVFLLPVVTIWLFYVHDLMRNVFLRVGHSGMLKMIKHTSVFTLIFVFPLFLAIFAIEYEQYVDKESLVLIGLTMLSWMFCLVWVSNDLYLKIAKALGVQTGE
jgi:hypothetical protein